MAGAIGGLVPDKTVNSGAEARHAKQYRGNSSNLDDLSARNWIAEQPNGVF
jgi:hypothetical protein